ncbi:hypothetical protein BMI86_10220 [Thioclava sp. DLFJ5-1]|nr:hypothetical protein BMI86_10220 [Thioclava sp. DLFJ5-1]
MGSIVSARAAKRVIVQTKLSIDRTRDYSNIKQQRHQCGDFIKWCSSMIVGIVSIERNAYVICDMPFGS